jgi:hypothetical protein
MSDILGLGIGIKGVEVFRSKIKWQICKIIVGYCSTTLLMKFGNTDFFWAEFVFIFRTLSVLDFLRGNISLGKRILGETSCLGQKTGKWRWIEKVV